MEPSYNGSTALGPVGVSINYSSDGESIEAPAERWAPLGAVADSISPTTSEDLSSGTMNIDGSDIEYLREENEKMATSLLSLTSHFAQVQFRLKQIIEGPDEMKAERLKELDVFAERGIPDIKSCILSTDEEANEAVEEEYQRKLNIKQKEMISELKHQLADLESYAYENGLADELPTNTVLEKQEIIIEEVKRKLQISHFDNLATLNSEQLKECVDEAIGQIVNPAKAKEKQLEQLRTQVNDLERFVDFLQAEVTSAKQSVTAETKSKPSSQQYLSPDTAYRAVYNGKTPTAQVRTQGTGSSDKNDTEPPESRSSRIKKILTVLHMFILSELGCASKQHDRKRNEMKERSKEPHYGDMLAELQMSVDELIDTAERVKVDRDNDVFADCDYLSDEEAYISESKQLTQCVRKRFSMSLRKLIEHGAACQQSNSNKAIIPFGCTSGHSITVTTEDVHAWKIILMYYDIKDGKAFNETPYRKLADSFGIQAPIESEATVKHTLLGAIGHIIDTHTPYHRSEDAHFKAFVSLALNEKKLVPWLRQIFRTSAVIDEYYQPWSYLVKTNFEDAFCSMNKLKLYDFNLPVDLAVKQFSNIKDAF